MVCFLPCVSVCGVCCLSLSLYLLLQRPASSTTCP